MKHEVMVLLATYNGEKYLRQQLESIFAQKDVCVKMFVRDDGSRDNTINILNEYQESGKLRFVTGANKGAFANFMELIRTCSECEYYAYSDQDDVWLPEKLIEAIKLMENSGTNDEPCLYFGKNVAVDDKLQSCTDKRHAPFRQQDNFALATMRNICQGSTCVLNAALMKKLKRTPINLKVEHDWWTYIVCLGIGGRIITDERPYLLYRQHGANVLGDSISIVRRLARRGKLIFSKRTHTRQKMCEALIETYGDELTSEANKKASKICVYRKSNIEWFRLLFDIEFYKGGIEYSLSFLIAVIMRII